MGAYVLLTQRSQAIAPHWPLAELVAAPLDAVEVARTARWVADGEPLVVERGAQGWRVRSGVLGLMRADTPEEALASFATALVSRDYAALLRLVPEAERASWSVDRLHEVFEDPRVRPRWLALAQALRTEAVVLSWLDRARVRARVGAATVALIREPTGWKVFDVSPASDYTPR